MHKLTRLLSPMLAVVLAACASHKPTERSLAEPYAKVRSVLGSLNQKPLTRDGWVSFVTDKPDHCRVRLFGPASVSHFQNDIALRSAPDAGTIAAASTDFDLFWFRFAAPSAAEKARRRVEEHLLDVLEDAVRTQRTLHSFWADLWLMPFLP